MNGTSRKHQHHHARSRFARPGAEHRAGPRRRWAWLSVALTLAMGVLALPFLGAPVSAEQGGDGIPTTACDQKGAHVGSFQQSLFSEGPWQQGNVIDGLHEGDVVWEKVELSRLDPGPHELVIDYTYQRDGKYAFDYLVASDAAISVSPDQPNKNEVFKRATFTWVQPAGVDSRTITFAAHIGVGAADIPGSSYDLKLQTLDCDNTGAKTNQVKVDKQVAPTLGTVTVKKVDAADDKALDTATFQLWNDVNGNKTLDPADTKAGAVKSTSNGTATWTDLSDGDYLVEETAAPAGYTLPSPAYQPVTVDKSHPSTTLTFKDAKKPVPPTGSLSYRKHAGSTGGAQIDTATFQLWNDVNGNGALDPADTKAGAAKGTSGGTATWSGLPFGKYLVEETVAPAGYTLPSPAHQAATVTGAVTLDFVDQPKVTPPPVTPQVDLRARKHAGSLAGRLIDTATFQLWNDVDHNGALDKAVDTKAGAAVDTSGGTATWTGLAVGAYLVQEVRAPEGYSLPSPRYQPVTLAAADLGTTVTVDFADAQIAGVEENRPPAQVAPAAGEAAGEAGGGPSYGGVQTLPQTGARERNQLLGLLGAALVALGGGLLMRSGRRSIQR
jgi:LPXTG-motif cell wall-anchored protein